MKTSRILLPIILGLAFITTVGLVYGATNSTSTSTAPVIPMLSLTDIVVGAFTGAVYGGLGYYNDIQKNTSEKFNSRQYALTIIVGGILGIFVPIAQPTDLSGLASAGFTAFTSFGAIYFIQKLIGIANAFHTLGKSASTAPTNA